MKKPSTTLPVRNVIAPPPRPTLFAATLLATLLSLPVALATLIASIFSG